MDKEQAKRGGKGGFTTTEGYKKCERILAQLKKHPCAGQFMVAPTLAPEFKDRVKEPMDLTIVERKLKGGVYPSSYHFALDIRKIWNNSWAVYPPSTELYNYTTEISNYFEKLMKEIGDVPIVPEESVQLQELKKKMSKVEGTLRRFESGAAVAAVRPPTGTHKAPSAMDKPMTAQEKALLRQNIMKLPQEKLQGVIAIIRDSIDMEKNKEVLEFDIDALPTRKCRELDLYVKKSIPSAQKAGKKKQAKTKSKTKPVLQEAPAPVAAPATAQRREEEEKKGPEERMQDVPQRQVEHSVSITEVQPSPVQTPMIGVSFPAGPRPDEKPMATPSFRTVEQRKANEPNSMSKSGKRMGIITGADEDSESEESSESDEEDEARPGVPKPGASAGFPGYRQGP